MKKKIITNYTNIDTGLSRAELLQEPGISIKDIKKALQGVDAYTLNRPVKRNFQTGQVYVGKIDQQ